MLWMFFSMLFESYPIQGRIYYPHGTYIRIPNYQGPQDPDDECEMRALDHFRVVRKWKKVLGITIIAMYFVTQIFNHYGLS